MSAPVQAYRPTVPVRSEYWTRLKERVAMWKEKHAEEYAALEVAAINDAELAMKPLRPGQQMVINAVVAERVRVKNKWPSQAEFEAPKLPPTEQEDET